MRRFDPIAFLGQIIYRPPTGKPEDRMLAIATGKTETGDKVTVVKPDKTSHTNPLTFNALLAAVYFARHNNAV